MGTEELMGFTHEGDLKSQWEQLRPSRPLLSFSGGPVPHRDDSVPVTPRGKAAATSAR